MYKGDDDTVSQRAFKTKDEFINKIKEYVEVCKTKKELPNVAGFCVYCNINRDTFYTLYFYCNITYYTFLYPYTSYTYSSCNVHN